MFVKIVMFNEKLVEILEKIFSRYVDSTGGSADSSFNIMSSSTLFSVCGFINFASGSLCYHKGLEIGSCPIIISR